MELIFATGNPGKVREVQQICDTIGKEFGISLTIKPMPDKVDIPETGDTYHENALQKAEYVWKRYGKNCMADDSGLEVDCLGGAPGLHTARYCGHDFIKGIDKLLEEMKGEDDRRAAFKCCIALIINGETYYFDGACHGRIALEAKGAAGFGFDPVFIPDATQGRRMAELPEQEKNRISHRGLAMRKMVEWLATKPEKEDI